VSSLLSAFVLSFTVITVVASGIFAAYASVIGILHLLAPQQVERPGRPVLVTQQAHVGGD